MRWWREELKDVLRLLLARSATERRAVWPTLRRGWAACRQEILDAASVLLPNSNAEAEILAQECSARKRIQVVPNAVELGRCRSMGLTGSTAERTGILCVGHFDPRKNQLWLVEALRGTGSSITFVGEGRRWHRRYARRCRRRGAGTHRFEGSVPRDGVLELMARAKAHVSPSRYETPGLVNLEAAVMGCSVVVAECPPTREYFADHAHYFLCGDRESLRRALSEALAQPPDPALKDRVTSHYTWEVAAEKTHEAYLSVL
jgi:glycosyltransferase involved in cell wall biosynthesis